MKTFYQKLDNVLYSVVWNNHDSHFINFWLFPCQLGLLGIASVLMSVCLLGTNFFPFWVETINFSCFYLINDYYLTFWYANYFSLHANIFFLIQYALLKRWFISGNISRVYNQNNQLSRVYFILNANIFTLLFDFLIASHCSKIQSNKQLISQNIFHFPMLIGHGDNVNIQKKIRLHGGFSKNLNFEHNEKFF